MFSGLRSPRVWTLINVFGISMFLLIASSFWIEPELAAVAGASGGAAIGWIAYAAPILLLFVVANIGWLALALVTGPPEERPRTVVIGSFMLLCWAAAFYIDNAHHGA